jgi:hypothetical protein
MDVQHSGNKMRTHPGKRIATFFCFETHILFGLTEQTELQDELLHTELLVCCFCKDPNMELKIMAVANMDTLMVFPKQSSVDTRIS